MNADKPAHTSGMYGVSLSEELELQQEVLRSVWVGRLESWLSLPHFLHQFAALFLIQGHQQSRNTYHTKFSQFVDQSDLVNTNNGISLYVHSEPNRALAPLHHTHQHVSTRTSML